MRVWCKNQTVSTTFCSLTITFMFSRLAVDTFVENREFMRAIVPYLPVINSLFIVY